jgi:hypothetical protein
MQIEQKIQAELGQPLFFGMNCVHLYFKYTHVSRVEKCFLFFFNHLVISRPVWQILGGWVTPERKLLHHLGLRDGIALVHGFNPFIWSMISHVCEISITGRLFYLSMLTGILGGAIQKLTGHTVIVIYIECMDNYMGNFN